MKIVQILHEFPYPANNGIRCDMVRRLDSFLALGHEVWAITWPTSNTDRAQVETLWKRLAGLTLLPPAHSTAAKVRRLWNMRRHPSYVAARIPARGDMASIIASLRAFAPDLIWLEGIHPAWIALELQRRLAIPLAYRSHNIEHRYLAEQASLARSARQRLALRTGTWGLEATERRVHARAERVFDISADDLAYWQAQGFTRSTNLLPQPDPAIIATMAVPMQDRDIDLLYVGGLAAPNNVAGLEWFFANVHPLLRQQSPTLRIAIAGRAPGRALQALCTAAGVELIADPSDITSVLRRARVMMNPIFHGSGMNIKTVDMLASGQPVITTTKGARGLPPEVMAELTIADTPDDFARAITRHCAAVSNRPSGGDRAALIERWFGDAAVSQALSFFTREGGPSCSAPC